MEDNMKALELKALAALEKHIEALAVELSDIAKEIGDIQIEKANPFVKLFYGATKEQILVIMKSLISKIDLDKDGK